MKKKVVAPNDNKMSTGTPATFKGRIEKDIDDLVHSHEEEISGEQNEFDPDDRVHQPDRSKPGQIDQDSLEDPDDLVHDNRDEDDDR